jgi:predicted DsbA family dithiol-disulfide isomerase
MLNTHDLIAKRLSLSIFLPLAWTALLAVSGCSGQNLGQDAVSAGPGAKPTSLPGDEAVAAVIDGRSISLGDVHEHMKQQFITEFARQPEDRQFEMRESAIRELVEQHIYQSEAAKQGKTEEEVALGITSEVAEPTLSEITTWYKTNQVRLRGAPLEDVADSIKQLLANEREAEARRAFLEPRLASLSWQMVLEPPRTALDATRLVRGPANAPVTIMAFSDYQCPYCVRAEPILAEVLERYPDQVRLVHRHFPLESHPFARPAAEAAMCADEQGKFWEYHDAIFAKAGHLDENSLAEIGGALGLDAEKFGACVEERRYRDFVEADFTAGREAGVSGTPSFFLNGIALKGARDADELSRYVELELARVSPPAKSQPSPE